MGCRGPDATKVEEGQKGWRVQVVLLHPLACSDALLSPVVFVAPGGSSDYEDHGHRRVSQNGLADGANTPQGWGQVPRSYPAPSPEHLV